MGAFLLALAVLSACVQGEELDLAAIKKMKMVDLRKMLDNRGVQCEGCAEKGDYVAKVFETQHLPEVNLPGGMDGQQTTSVSPEDMNQNMPPGGLDMDEIMKRFSGGSERKTRIKKMLKDRGYDPSLADKVSTSSGSTDEEMVEMLIKISGALGKAKTGSGDDDVPAAASTPTAKRAARPTKAAGPTATASSGKGEGKGASGQGFSTPLPSKQPASKSSSSKGTTSAGAASATGKAAKPSASKAATASATATKAPSRRPTVTSRPARPRPTLSRTAAREEQEREAGGAVDDREDEHIEL